MNSLGSTSRLIRAASHVRPRSVRTSLLHSHSTSSKHADRDRYSAIHEFFTRRTHSFPQTLPRRDIRKETITVTTQRNFHISFYRLTDQNKPGKDNEYHAVQTTNNDAHNASSEAESNSKDKQPEKSPNHTLENYPAFIRRLSSALPHLEFRRPTKEELLEVTTGWWHRLQIRFKWFTIRSFRKFNSDDISAFLSWLVLGNAIWIVIGTTTFASMIFATMNSLQMQEFVAQEISNYMTRQTGVLIVFEHAVVPKWKDGKISFKKTYISKRPSDETFVPPGRKVKRRIHPAHAAATRLDVHHPGLHEHEDDDYHPSPSEPKTDIPLDDQVTMFDLEVDSIDVELSFSRWFDGKGLIQNAVIKGVRGVVDRSRVPITSDPNIDLASFRRSPSYGDFELESLQLEDVLVTVYQPGGFRPYTASIFQADFRLLRKQWLFYDLLSAKSVVGQFDNCLFSLHEPQSIGRTMEEDLKDSQWKRMSRFRIDGVNIDHLQAATGVTGGPISWIKSGKVDAVFDIKFPREASEDVDLPMILSEIANTISAAAGNVTTEFEEETSTLDKERERIPGQRKLAKPALRPPSPSLPADGLLAGFYGLAGVDGENRKQIPEQKVVIDIDLRFRDLKAVVPIFNSELSYVNNALIRPIVAFINANKTLVPIHCVVVKDLSDFNGAWTAWETGLTDAMAQQIYDALAYHVVQANRKLRIKTVSAWSLQRTGQVMLSALRNIVDPISAHLRILYSMDGADL